MNLSMRSVRKKRILSIDTSSEKLVDVARNPIDNIFYTPPLPSVASKSNEHIISSFFNECRNVSTSLSTIVGPHSFTFAHKSSRERSFIFLKRSRRCMCCTEVVAVLHYWHVRHFRTPITGINFLPPLISVFG